MARRRFLVQEIRNGAAELRGEDARHLAKVLRAEPGQQYEISDGTHLCLAEVAGVERDRVLFRVLADLETPELPLNLALYVALIKFDRFEWMVEKATELGVSFIVPVDAARSGKGLLEAARNRVERWRRIAHESSQQSRRLRPPEIGEPRTLSAALPETCHLGYFLDEEPGCPPLASALPAPSERHPSDSAALLIGPEGGWTEAERATALAAGWRAVSLGPLILRAETAAITATALLVYGWWTCQLE